MIPKPVGSGLKRCAGLACVIWLGCACGASAESGMPSIRIRLELTDGSSLVAKSGIEAVEVRTEYAILSIPLADITLLTRNTGASGVSVSVRNGDKITGQLERLKWPVTAEIGELNLDTTLIRRLTPAADSAVAAKGLVLWNGLGSAEEVRNSFIGAGGSVRGNVLFVPGKEGGGAQVSGSGGIHFPPESLRGLNQPTTIEWWMRIPESEGRQKLLLWSHHAERAASIWCALMADRRLGLGLTNRSGDMFIEPCPVSGPLAPGDWHHVAICWDVVNTIDGTDTVRVYLDGTITFRSSSRPRDTPNPFRAVDGHLNIIMGCQGYGGKLNDSVFDGVIDDLKVWDHVVTEFEVGGPRE